MMPDPAGRLDSEKLSNNVRHFMFGPNPTFSNSSSSQQIRHSRSNVLSRRDSLQNEFVQHKMPRIGHTATLQKEKSNSSLFSSNRGKAQEVTRYDPVIHSRFSSESTIVVQTPALKDIKWKDGYLPEELGECPFAILELIKNNLQEFETEVLSSTWPVGKETYTSDDRQVIYVEDRTGESDPFPVTRYTYGNTKQFFVAWLSGERSDELQPHIMIHHGRGTGQIGHVLRNGMNYRTVPYITWAPYSSLTSKIVFRLIAFDKADNTSQQNIHQTNSEIIHVESSSEEDTTRSYNTEVYPGVDTRSIARKAPCLKRQKLSHDISEESVPLQASEPSTITTSEHNPFRFDFTIASKIVVLYLPSDKLEKFVKPREHNQAEIIANSIEDTGQKHGSSLDRDYPNVTVICTDVYGNTEGTFPFHECDTAQKLFEVACVSQIAQIEPPATRLLKVSFEDGSGGRIRPDNIHDFDNVVLGLLRPLSKDKKTHIRINLSPYL